MIYFTDKFIIGIGGVARSGKDTLARVFAKILQQRGYNVVIDSFAKPLRDDSDDFLYENFGISAFTTDNKEKEIIRPFLVGFAECHRKQTKGGFFWRKMAERIEPLASGTIILIPDLRFAEYQEDEIDFVNRNGWSFHLSLFNERGGKTGPANRTEAVNDTLLKKKCIEKLEWDATIDPETVYIKFGEQALGGKIMENIKYKCSSRV